MHPIASSLHAGASGRRSGSETLACARRSGRASRPRPRSQCSRVHSTAATASSSRRLLRVAANRKAHAQDRRDLRDGRDLRARTERIRNGRKEPGKFCNPHDQSKRGSQPHPRAHAGHPATGPREKNGPNPIRPARTSPHPSPPNS
jgi:hypothetical protein